MMELFFPSCATEGICLSLNAWNAIERWIKSISGHLRNFILITHTNMYTAQPWSKVQSFTCTEKISSYGYSISLWILVDCTNSSPIVIWRIMATYSQLGIISYFLHELNRNSTWATEVAVDSRKFENSSIALAVLHVCGPCMQFFYMYIWNFFNIYI